MYAHGDVPNPADDTVDVMEDLLMGFINDLVSIETGFLGGWASGSWTTCVFESDDTIRMR
jgi:hypothetical protein